jgi:hypothetical protein
LVFGGGYKRETGGGKKEKKGGVQSGKSTVAHQSPRPGASAGRGILTKQE